MTSLLTGDPASKLSTASVHVFGNCSRFKQLGPDEEE